MHRQFRPVVLAALVVVLIACAGCGGRPADPAPGGASVAGPMVPSTSPRGTWVWRRDSWVTPEARAALLAFCREHRLGTVLLQVRTDWEAAQPVLLDQDDLGAVLGAAAGVGIAVHLLDGNSTWIEDPWPARLAGQVRAAGAFNRQRAAAGLPGRFAGVHYDVEPYTVPGFKDPARREAICAGYLRLIDGLAPLARAEGLAFSVDVPSWYDSRTDLPRFRDPDGSQRTMLERVARTVDWLGIMSYRTTVPGPNGVIEISEGELRQMAALGKVAWVGIETGDNIGDSPAHITFHGRPAGSVQAAIAEIEQSLAGRPGYGGLLVHSYEHYRNWLATQR